MALMMSRPSHPEDPFLQPEEPALSCGLLAVRCLLGFLLLLEGLFGGCLSRVLYEIRGHGGASMFWMRHSNS